ncbi:Pyruvate-flavodoxin oxidoreductase [Trichinella spiralis]|uniref:Pyruvate-flavodoxin oxidoreductase n=1 Tax=Trichinella spiralis TaxID=6334 RepID=A0ABR3KLB2_TRISP
MNSKLQTAIFLLFISVTNASHRLTTDQLSMTDRVVSCRAHCIDAFSVGLHLSSDFTCKMHADCHMCWENCGMFYHQFGIWGSICKDPVVCFSGCQLACSIYRQNLTNRSDRSVAWAFAEPMKVIRSPAISKLEVQWNAPIPLLPLSPPFPNMVYALFWKMDRRPNIWFPLNHTVGNSYVTGNVDIVHSGIDFLLLAYTRQGRIAVSQFREYNPPKAILPLIKNSTAVNNIESPGGSKDTEFYLYLSAAIFAAAVICCVVVILMFRLYTFCIRWKSLNRSNAIQFKRRPTIQSQNEPFSLKKKGDSTRQSTTTLASNKNLIRVSKSNRRFRKVAIPTPHTYVNVRVPSPHRFKKDDLVVNGNRYSLSDCVLKILERPDGKDQILLNPYELKKRLEEQLSVIV